VFRWLAAVGGVAGPEMLRTFQLRDRDGRGARSRGADAAIKAWTDAGETVARLGSVVALKPGVPEVSYDAGRLDLAW